MSEKQKLRLVRTYHSQFLPCLVCKGQEFEVWLETEADKTGIYCQNWGRRVGSWQDVKKKTT